MQLLTGSRWPFRVLLITCCLQRTIAICQLKTAPEIAGIRSGFRAPAPQARPGVYWYFMDGNMSSTSITADLESMKKAGIGNLIFLEVNVDIPRGKVDFLSDEWIELFNHAEKEARRLGIEITLGTGPGWAGSGGPWVKPDQSMQHLVASVTNVSGPAGPPNDRKKIMLPVPEPRKPFFGYDVFTPDLRLQWTNFYEDIAVLAFPEPASDKKIEDIDEKSLYYRAPYTSQSGVKRFLPSLPAYDGWPQAAVIAKDRILDLTGRLTTDGSLDWEVPAGNWTIMRFGRRNNGAITRPAPYSGLGFEADKFDTSAMNAHLDHYLGKLLARIGTPDPGSPGGLKMLHIDSWEMGAQNWTPHFREEFIRRRGYDPLPFYPVYTGMVVGSLEISERFLWDLRLTCQELVLEYHAGHVRNYSHRHGLGLSIEPYDMNPAADLELGTEADIPMCEFWSKCYGYNSSFSCIEATSIAHIKGTALVPAEAFTAEGQEGWKQYPGSMKNQTDWAFATGINALVFHTFQNQFLPDSLRPGATMGPYGVHWDRGQTWWPMVGDYHLYVSRCQSVLRQGTAVADVLYLTPEGAPHVFRAPSSALDGDSILPDRKGFDFDGCSPGQLYAASIIDHRIVFPGGASYRILVLPATRTMTPRLLEKIRTLVDEGATVIGSLPVKSPGLSGYPECDQKVRSIAAELSGGKVGKGRMIQPGDTILTNDEATGLYPPDPVTAALYPPYATTAALLHKMGISEDFESPAPIRYTHRTGKDWDIYFVANRSDAPITAECIFRSDKDAPELWDPLTGTIRPLPVYSRKEGRTVLPLQFDRYQSFFVVFRKDLGSGKKYPGFGKNDSDFGSKNSRNIPAARVMKNFPAQVQVKTLDGPWNVSFDPHWGGPEKSVFDSLMDWTASSNQGIRYYSGIAAYHKNFDLSVRARFHRLYLDLGEVKNMARVRLNGKDLGVVWTSPLRVDITEVVKSNGNQLTIEVANLWPNRLIGDEQLPDDGIKDGQWPEWLTKGQPRTSGRYTFTTWRHYSKDLPLLSSGLLGPVRILGENF